MIENSVATLCGTPWLESMNTQIYLLSQR